MQNAQTQVINSQIALFDADANFWWKPGGPFDLLHAMNPLRLSYIQDCIGNLKGLRILDVGCGGGILSEPLSRLGADITGIDATASAIEVANIHSKSMGLSITYTQSTIEEFSANLAPENQFDLIIASEIIEHVPDPSSFLKACLSCLKLNSTEYKNKGLIVSTLNRTPHSYLGAILGAEYILRWVPRGTHEWKRFLKPSEIQNLLQRHTNTAEIKSKNYAWKDIRGMALNPLTKQWRFTKDLSINYIGWISN